MKKYQIILGGEIDQFIKIIKLIGEELGPYELVIFAENFCYIKLERKMDAVWLYRKFINYFEEHPEVFNKAMIASKREDFDKVALLLNRIALKGLFLTREVDTNARSVELVKFKHFKAVKIISADDYYNPEKLNHNLMKSAFYSYYKKKEGFEEERTISLYYNLYSENNFFNYNEQDNDGV